MKLLKPKNTEIKNLVLIICVSVVAIFLPAWLFNKWVEGIFFFFCHWFIREQYPSQYHHILHSMCRLITGSIFFFGVCFVLPMSISLFSAIPINYFIGWIGYTKHEADKFEVKCKRLMTPKPFNTDTCSRQELIDRCNALNFDKENIDLAVDFFIDQTKQSIIADRLAVDEKSVQQRKRRMKKQLNI